MARGSNIEQSSIDAKTCSRVRDAQANSEFCRNVAPDGRRVAQISSPNDGVYKIYAVSDEYPKDEEECAKVAGLPVPWKRKEDEDHAEKGHEGEDVALSVAGHCCYFVDRRWVKKLVFDREIRLSDR